MRPSPSAAAQSTYARVADPSIIQAQGLDTLNDTWAVVRVSGSVHGNYMFYPTRFPGQKDTLVEFSPEGRVVVYSSQSSHAIYATPGVHKRILGFANDVTEQGKLWKPASVNLFAFGGLHILLDVEKKRASSKPIPSLLLMGHFAGAIGRIHAASQHLVPFKNGVLNKISSGDAYYKLVQVAGASGAIADKIGDPAKWVCRGQIASLVCFVLLLVTSKWAMRCLQQCSGGQCALGKACVSTSKQVAVIALSTVTSIIFGAIVAITVLIMLISDYESPFINKFRNKLMSK